MTVDVLEFWHPETGCPERGIYSPARLVPKPENPHQEPDVRCEVCGAHYVREIRAGEGTT